MLIAYDYYDAAISATQSLLYFRGLNLILPDSFIRNDRYSITNCLFTSKHMQK